MSPWLFNLYIDVIINKLVNSDVGCDIFDSYVGFIVYADDVLLLSSSIVLLQRAQTFKISWCEFHIWMYARC